MLPDPQTPRRSPDLARVEAFSDGVVAIIITIMVLELRAPEEASLAALWRLGPVVLAYAMSYGYVAIYWVNHHRLFGHAMVVTNGLLWSNFALLFTLSLIPFSTAYLGHHLASQTAAVVYDVSLLLPALAYYWLESVICRSGSQTAKAKAYYRATSTKAIAAIAVYTVAIAISTRWPAVGVTLTGLVGMAWILPW